MRTAINPLGVRDMAKDYIIDYGNNGISGNGYQWYRIWKSGWLEQGGEILGTREYTIRSFLKPYININYTIIGGYNGQNNTSVSFNSVTGLVLYKLNNMQFKSAIYGANGYEIISWYASGY